MYLLTEFCLKLKTNNEMKIAIKKIKEVRAFTELKQEDFAKEIGVSTSLLGKVESGNYHDESIVIAKIIKRYGVDEKFFKGDAELKITTLRNLNANTDNSNPWREEAYQALKDEVNEWRKKHTDAMDMLSRMIDRMQPGKHNPLNFAAGRKNPVFKGN